MLKLSLSASTSIKLLSERASFASLAWNRSLVNTKLARAGAQDRLLIMDLVYLDLWRQHFDGCDHWSVSEPWRSTRIILRAFFRSKILSGLQ